MGKIVSNVSLAVAVVGLLVFGIAAPASAHVTVRPAEAVTAGYQTFTVNVPNERELPTTTVRVVIPRNIESATPTQKAGWVIATEKDGDKVSSITWSGGEIPDGTRDEFTFSAKLPAEETDIQWKAYQTYADGTVVSWDQASEGGHGSGDANKGPFSVTKVVTETEQDKAIREAKQEAQAAQASTRMALYSSITAVIVALIAVYIGTRKAK